LTFEAIHLRLQNQRDRAAAVGFVLMPELTRRDRQTTDGTPASFF